MRKNKQLGAIFKNKKVLALLQTNVNKMHEMQMEIPMGFGTERPG
jgi:hypothetical protein